MRRTLLLLVVLSLTSGNLFAAWDRSADLESERIGRSRHYIYSPPRVLTAAEQGRLAEGGVEITSALSNGRYLVRVAPGVAVDASFERLTGEKKIHQAALRGIAKGRAFARVNVLFHDGVGFEAAKDVIAAAGGAMEDPLQLGFHVPSRIAARIPSMSLLTFAGDERILMVQGPARLKAALDNATTARLSGVDVIQQTPYGLTGEGVTLSFFEFAPADSTHVEFGGRLTTHLTGTETGDVEHATHVAGTMIAAGSNAPAKGMAPLATLHEFSARGDSMFSRKEALPTFGAVSDNNSWGYVLGWCTAPSCEGWVWDDTEEYYGAYDVTYTAPIDRISRSTNVLFVHSAGNDAEKRGPMAVPNAHRHTDDAGDLITGTFCYSQNGSGTDCPAPTCTAGVAPGGFAYCETKRHPEIIAELPAPYGSVGLTASAKNIIAVGAVDTGGNIASFSSRGPARDGRVKPDLVARGVSVFSTRPNGLYGNKNGTSMSSPAVTGMSALLTQQWRRTYAGANPTPAVVKTLFIAGAQDLGRPGPDYTYGFGLANAKNSVDLIIADGGVGRRVKRGAIATGASFETPLTVGATQNLRVVLGWSDPEVIIFPQDGLAAATLVNDLDVKLVTPAGETILPYILDRAQPAQDATRGVNTIDNTEVIEIANAASGTYRVIVTGTRITAQSPQAFVMVANAELEAEAPPCTEIGEPNGSETTALSLPRLTPVAGKTCEAGDVDFFRFGVNKSGTISVQVEASDTQLRAILTSTVTSPAIVEIPAGQTRTLSVPYNSAGATEFFLRIEATGPIGVTGAYTVTADYPFEAGSRRRAVRR